MCTVTLRCGGGLLLLTMNRDERYERAPESAPRRIAGDPVRPAWIAPFDGATGGTWIGVSERGVAACLLNGYTENDRELAGSRGVPSRGSIVPRILEEQEGTGPVRVPGQLDFSAYPSFTLLAVSPDGGEIVSWVRGRSVERRPVGLGWILLTSSSWNEPEVARWRQLAFASWRGSGEPLDHGVPTVHVLAPPGEEAVAPFMTREHSATRSISQVRVDRQSGVASLCWWSRSGRDPIDLGSSGVSLDLPLAPAGAPSSGAHS